MPKVSVVVVTRNRARRLEALLASLAAQSLQEEFEVIVVDDSSHDGTADLLAGRDCTFVGSKGRPGLAALRNLGWRAGTSALVCFIDDDCEADPAWLKMISETAARNPAGFVQGRTVPIERELGASGPLSRTKLIEAAGPWFQTCNIAYPRALLEGLGGFDESFAVAGEDTDLGWRAIEAGAQAVYAPEAVARHAVERIGAGGWFRIAGRERILSPLFRRHAALRRDVVRLGVFKSDQHAFFVGAVAGAVLAVRWRPALALGLPYARLVAARCRADGAGFHWMGWYVALDAVAVANSTRGAIESRVPVI